MVKEGFTVIPQMFWSRSGLAAARPAAAGIPNGSLWYSTDTHDIDQVQGGAWATIVDYSVITSGGLTVAETEVFAGNAPNAWTDLDLSGTIGANPAEVLLKVARNAGAINAVAFRKNGDVDEFYETTKAYMGVALVDVVAAALHFVVKVATDAAGIIEWRAETVDSCTIDIIDYIV